MGLSWAGGSQLEGPIHHCCLAACPAGWPRVLWFLPKASGCLTQNQIPSPDPHFGFIKNHPPTWEAQGGWKEAALGRCEEGQHFSPGSSKSASLTPTALLLPSWLPCIFFVNYSHWVIMHSNTFAFIVSPRGALYEKISVVLRIRSHCSFINSFTRFTLLWENYDVFRELTYSQKTVDQCDGKYHEVLLLQFTVWEVEKADSSSSSSNNHTSYIRVLPKHQDLCWAAHISLFILYRISSGRTMLNSMAQKKVPQLREGKGLALNQTQGSR